MPTTTLPLKDLHLPPAIGWWPPALGWWLVALAVPLCLAGGYWLYKRLTRKTAVKTANQQLLAIKHNTALTTLEKLGALSILLRRVAISLYPRAEVAALTGQQWLAFLDRALPNAPFSSGSGQLLVTANYRNSLPSEQELSDLLSLCEAWLKAQSKQPQITSRP